MGKCITKRKRRRRGEFPVRRTDRRLLGKGGQAENEIWIRFERIKFVRASTFSACESARCSNTRR